MIALLAFQSLQLSGVQEEHPIGDVQVTFMVEDSGDLQVGVGKRNCPAIDAKFQKDLTIPDAIEVDGKTHRITKVNNYAFYGTNITRITLSKGITELGQHIFEGCSCLEYADLSELVIFILPDYLFSNCKKLENVLLPKVTFIDRNAFENTVINKFDFARVDSIGDYSFYGTQIVDLDLTESQITRIPTFAFAKMEKLLTIKLPKDLIFIESNAFSFDSIKSIELPGQLEELGEEVFANCQYLTSVKLSPKLRTLDSGIFTKCESLTAIEIPDSIKTIGDRTFADTKIASIKIPSTVEYIGKECFAHCIDLESIELAHTAIKEIPDLCFQHCINLMRVTLPPKLYKIGDSAFAFTSLTSVSFPPSLAEIGNSSFLQCKRLFDVDLGNTKIVEIPGDAFKDIPALGTLTLPGTLRVVGDRAFTGCSIVSVRFPASCELIGNSSFQECSFLTTADLLSTSITRIEDFAFSMCSSLGTLLLPPTLQYIGVGAFRHCDALTMVDMSRTNVSVLRNTAFFQCSSLFVVLPPVLEQVGSECFSDTLVEEFVFPPSLERLWDNSLADMLFLRTLDLSKTSIELIPVYCCMNDRSLVDVYLPDSVLTINKDAFSSCGIVAVSFGAGLEAMQERVFNRCRNLEDVDLSGTSLAFLSVRAFSECVSLKRVVLPDTIRRFADLVFANCVSLKEIILPPRVEMLGTHMFARSGIERFDMSRTTLNTLRLYLFEDCLSLKEVKLNEFVKIVGQQCFINCASLESIVFPPSLEVMYMNAFESCASLRSVDLSRCKMQLLNDFLFKNCSRLEEVMLPPTLDQVGADPFAQCVSLKTVYYCGENDLSQKTFFSGFAHPPVVVVADYYPSAKLGGVEAEKREECIPLPAPPPPAEPALPHPTMRPTESLSQSPTPSKSMFVAPPTPTPRRSPTRSNYVFPDELPPMSRTPKPTIDDGEGWEMGPVMWTALAGALIFASTAVCVCLYFSRSDKHLAADESNLMSPTPSEEISSVL